MSFLVFTGVRPTGQIHLGNLSCLFRCFQLAKKKGSKILIMIADLHAYTDQPYQDSSVNIINVAKMIIALGRYFQMSKDQVFIFKQSENKDHVELCWRLQCVTPMHMLNTIVTTKSKTGIHSGLKNYPVMMAADMALYQPCTILVGPDQKQHLEFYNKLMNRILWKRISISDSLDRAVSIRDLRNIKDKMSKSSRSKYGIIDIGDTFENIQDKFNKANVEDLHNGISGLDNLHNIWNLLTDEDLPNTTALLRERLPHLVHQFLSTLRQYLDELTDKIVSEWLQAGLIFAKHISRRNMTSILTNMISKKNDH